jgi:hypothetical protein
VMSSAAGLWKLFRDQAERGSGIGLKLFGIIPESRSPSTGFLSSRRAHQNETHRPAAPSPTADNQRQAFAAAIIGNR